MLQYRTFQNTDPPILASIWRSRSDQPGLLQPVSVDTFEQFVFGKLYFDYEGLVLAFDDDRPVGFAHAGFGPTPQGDRLATEQGVICVLMVRPDCACPTGEVAEGLLRESEAYLRRRGAKSVLGGAVQPVTPFYCGMYGGCTLPGVLESDAVARNLYQAHGYAEVSRTLLLSLDLSTFRAPIDRQQMQLRRKMLVEAKADAPVHSWWDACTIGDFELIQFDAVARGSSTVAASAVFREMDPGGALRAGRTIGLLDLQVDPAQRRQGLGTFTLAEAFRQLASQGVQTVQAQVAQQNTACLALFRKLGFQETQQAIVFRKEINGQ
ncbi:MAG: GNAT family N-acetyltransferase [Thermoguttaceae bacterium]|jgi:ribosomal protein S18 acetylase RimI-like enzyme